MTVFGGLFIFAVCFSVLPETITANTMCSPGNRNSNLSLCLDQITSMAQNRDAYWFGTPYRIRCPNPYASLVCFNISPFSADSIVSRVFGSNFTFNTALMDRFLDVTYTTETGKYESCGNTWTVDQSKVFSLDPLSQEVYFPWETKKIPEMRWRSETDEMFTLFVYDVGFKISHAVYVNIPQNKIELAEAFKKYSGPLRSSPVENVYAFLLFRQPGNITVSSDWQNKLPESMTNGLYTISEAAAALQLEGPIAMNWMEVTMDPYSIKSFIDLNIMYNCPFLITQAVQKHNRSFIPMTSEMTVGLDVQFVTADTLSFQSCCRLYNYQPKTVNLNPLGNHLVKAGYVRTGLKPYVTLQKLGYMNNYRNFTDTHYALIAVDPDVPMSTYGTTDSPLLHWMVINIQNGDVDDGTVVYSYRGPVPPDNKQHFYYFLLYEQTSMLNTDDMKNYTNPINSRYLFNISDFVTSNSLRLVGTTWMTVTTDEYVKNYYVTERGSNPSDICRGDPNFSDPCPVGRASVHERGLYLLILLVLILF